MPRQVDADARRLDIAAAAVRILARGGPQALTLKSLARELGGSITLVTHFVSSRDQLFEVITDDLTGHYEQMVDEVTGDAQGIERLWVLLIWMTPTTRDGIETEKGRIALNSHRHEHASIEHFFEAMEGRMRQLLRDRLRGLVPDDAIEHAVDYLRSVTNGITLSAVEHPGLWPPATVGDVLRTALRGLGIVQPGRTSEPAPALT